MGYDLQPDRTPPQLSIIAPLDGEFVPRGEITEIILRSYDRYGIDRVEACVDSHSADPFADAQACQRLADPSRLRLPIAAEATQPIRVVARAIDLNGLASAPASVTLQPYDSRAGAPELSFLVPADGLDVQAGETIPVRVRMRKLERRESRECGQNSSQGKCRLLFLTLIPFSLVMMVPRYLKLSLIV